MAVSNLDKIFRPRAIALLGRFDRRERTARIVLANLLCSGFAGPIYPVDRRGGTVESLPVVRRLNAVPPGVDLALICLPADEAIAAVTECGTQRIPGVVLLGMELRDPGRGAELARRLREQIARFPGIRVLGPNCLGLVAPYSRLNASLSSSPTRAGGVAFLSQSGAFSTSVLDWAFQEEMGFSHFVSLGDTLNVSLADLIDYCAADPYTRSIILFLESIRDARQFMSAARATTKSKPIVVYKSGRYAQSAAAVRSHTGALVGVDAVYEAAFSRAGIVRVHEIDDMFDCARLLSRGLQSPGQRLTIVTNAGGAGVVATDSLLARGGTLAVLAAETLQGLDAVVPAPWSRSNPVDIQGDATAERYRQVMDVVLRDPQTDVLLVILTPHVMTNPMHAARVVAEAAHRSRKPILACFMGGRSIRDSVELLQESGVPTYATPKNAVHAFMHLVQFQRNLETLYETPRDLSGDFPAHRHEQAALLSLQAGPAGGVVSERESKALLEAYGIPATQPSLATTVAQAVRLAEQLGGAVVLKVASPDVLHKTRSGGVVLNVHGAQAVRGAFEQIVGNVQRRHPAARIQGVTVEPMVAIADATEVALGCRTDPVFGAVILVGAGGVVAELLEDRAVQLPPLNERLARRMLESLRLWPLLAGEQGRPSVDVDALINVLIRFSYLVADLPQIQEMDINPVLASPSGTLALDARVILNPEACVNVRRRFAHLAIRPYPEELVRTAQLNDNTAIVLRPIMPEDEPRWHALLKACSLETIRSRFHSLFREMSHQMATRYCFLDYDRELAMVAELEHNGARQLIGVAQLMCDVDHVSAEFALLVADAWQGRGVGRRLTECCLDVAGQWGLARVCAETTADNGGMLALFRQCGFELENQPLCEEVRAVKRLSQHAVDTARTPAGS